jgi:hypothetical protein
VTASNAWPNFYLRDGREVDKQVAAPAETRTPNLHRATKSLTESADGRVATAGGSAEEKQVTNQNHAEST